MKTNMRVMYKKIAFIFLILGFFTVVETVISKGLSASRPQIQPIVVPVKEVPAKEVTIPAVPQNPTPQAEQTSQLPQGTLSLEQIHTYFPDGNAQTTRSTSVAVPATDKFTQSQAHMSVPAVKKLIDAKYDTKKYKNIIDAILAREQEYKNDYVFYHGMDNVWRVPQDLYTKLYIHFKKLPENIFQHFIFLRFDGVKNSTVIRQFVINKLKEGGLINDHELGDFLYAVNIALFGNVGTDPECTWQYFIKSRGHLNPDRKIYEQILDAFGLTHQYIDQLMALTTLYETTEETIVQIFVPTHNVDQIGYLSWIRGIPAHKKTMDMVTRSVHDKKFPKTAPALDYYTKIFKDEQQENPVFSNLLDRVRAGDFSLGYFLKFYRNYPDKIEDINSFQARLMFTHEVLLNPLSGVKVFRYCMATAQQMKNYQQKFDEIFNKIIAEKK
ncbi:MAG TPA: hypothetical protein VKU36_00830 [Candidatus Babeliales bacterium]|nr:hypothetical protein [Candidatus Babeliales bacterium]